MYSRGAALGRFPEAWATPKKRKKRSLDYLLSTEKVFE